MLKFLFTVRDSAAQVFAPPFIAPSEGFAIRMFRDAIVQKDVDNMMCKHPEDFELYIIASFEESDGRIEPCDPRLVIRGKDCLAIQ